MADSSICSVCLLFYKLSFLSWSHPGLQLKSRSGVSAGLNLSHRNIGRGTGEEGSSSLLSAVRVISLTFLWCIVETIKMFADYIVIGWYGGKKEEEMLLGCIKYLITLATLEGFIVIQLHKETLTKTKLPWSWINPWPSEIKRYYQKHNTIVYTLFSGLLMIN